MRSRSGFLAAVVPLLLLFLLAEPRAVESRDITVAVVSFGDTLVYTLTADSQPFATGYLWKVTASKTNAVWNGLPLNVSTPVPSITFQARGGPVPAWDSVTFTASLKATNLVSTSPDSLLRVWSTRRTHVGPMTGAIGVDSSGAGH